jgi:hypothetical protein
MGIIGTIFIGHLSGYLRHAQKRLILMVGPLR